MRQIDMKSWSRLKHFELYNTFDQPHFNMCANVDVKACYSYAKERGISFSIVIVYFISRAANAIPEFRYRIRPGNVVVEHEVVHPSITVLTDNDLFSFCSFDYCEDFRSFAEQAADKIAQVKAYPTLEDTPGKDDLLFMTAIPWVSFTSFMHPLNLKPVDSVPRFAWGRYYQDGERLRMPLSVQGHHAVMDGVHMGRFYTTIQSYLSLPGAALGE